MALSDLNDLDFSNAGSWPAVAKVIAIVLVILLVAIGYLWPRRFVRAPFRVLLALLYRREVHGLENLPASGGCVVISNHISYIDGILILWMLPRNVRFVVDGVDRQAMAYQISVSDGKVLRLAASP